MKLTDITALADNPEFKDWLTFELEHEDVTDQQGNIIDLLDRSDPGGSSFAGVDRRTHPDFPYPDPLPSDVVAAYEKDWTDCGAASLRAPVGAVLANFTVNIGKKAAVRLIQEVLGLAMDGVLGPLTWKEINSYPDSRLLALKVVTEADKRYKEMAKNNARLRKFLKKAEPDPLRPGSLS